MGCYITTLCLMTCMMFVTTLLTTMPSSASSGRFQLIILKQDWYDVKLGYKYSQALPILKSASEADTLFVIGISEVESYNWTRQCITLTAEATTRLIQALPQEQDLKEHIQYMANVKRKFGWGNPIEPALHLKGFLVKADDEVVYGGIFLEPMSELAIIYPVIRPWMVDRKAVLHLLPIQIPFVAYDPMMNDVAAWDAAIAPEGAKDWAQFPGHIKSHFIGMGTRQEAIEFRAILRNSKVREIMEQAGKLSQ
jgi:hypothetical protein